MFSTHRHRTAQLMCPLPWACARAVCTRGLPACHVISLGLLPRQSAGAAAGFSLVRTDSLLVVCFPCQPGTVSARGRPWLLTI